MPSSTPTSSVLFETDFGAVRPADGQLEVAFGAHTLSMDAQALIGFHESVATLAANAWRYETPCRWQLRIQVAPDQPVVVLCSDEVYRLKSLLDGAAAMLELEQILDEAQVIGPTITRTVPEEVASE